MSLVEIGRRFKQLGWENAPLADIPNLLKDQGISAAELMAYLDVAVASPAGWPVADAVALKITVFLKKQGLVVV